MEGVCSARDLGVEGFLLICLRCKVLAAMSASWIRGVCGLDGSSLSRLCSMSSAIRSLEGTLALEGTFCTVMYSPVRSSSVLIPCH